MWSVMTQTSKNLVCNQTNHWIIVVFMAIPRVTQMIEPYGGVGGPQLEP